MLSRVIPRRLIELRRLCLRQLERDARASQTDARNRRRLDSLLGSNQPIKLDLGAEKNRGAVGWTYVDVNGNCDLTLDLRNRLPFPDNSVSIIYSSHVLEHFEYSELVNLLAECLRVLKPGTTFSASVPNARLYIAGYLGSDSFDAGAFCRFKPAYHYHSKIDYVNYMAYMAGRHKYMFDEENIVDILRRAGFGHVGLRRFDPRLDLKNRDYESIYVEARK